MGRLILIFLGIFSMAACTEAGNIDIPAAMATAQVLLQTDKPIKSSGGDFTIEQGATCNRNKGFDGTVIFSDSHPEGYMALNYLDRNEAPVVFGYPVSDGFPKFDPTSPFGFTNLKGVVFDKPKHITINVRQSAPNGVEFCQLEFWDVQSGKPQKIASAMILTTAIYWPPNQYIIIEGRKTTPTPGR